MKKLRLIVDGKHPASWNMAVDEMLLEAQRPALRFYRWEGPAVTVGYFQKVDRVAKRFNVQKKNIDVVRRLTGGGAVLHGDDLTFSLLLPVPNGFFPTDVKSSYLKISEAVRLGLKGDFPKMDYADCRTVSSGKSQGGERVCFESPACYDLLLEGRKVMGSSQRRIGAFLLHQTTIFLDMPHDRLIRKILDGFEGSWAAAFEEAPLTREESEKAKKTEQKRYDSSEWAFLRERSFSS